MACPQCKINPKAHCFVNFARKDEIRYFYTGNSKETERIDTLEKIGYFYHTLNKLVKLLGSGSLIAQE